MEVRLLPLSILPLHVHPSPFPCSPTRHTRRTMALITCPECGNQVSETAPVCPHCGRANPGGGAQRPGDAYPPNGGRGFAGQGGGAAAPNYLVPAILVTVCCCLPAGIASVVFAAQANARRELGDAAGAWDAAGKAKLWAWVGLGLGILFYGGYAALFGIGLLAELGNMAL
jgi:hypothetical protein